MLLTDRDILSRGTNLIDPFDPKLVQPASYDLTLHHEVLRPKEFGTGLGPVMDLRKIKPEMIRGQLDKDSVIYPGECLLASTVETVRVPDNLAARVEGKSSLGRLFLSVHITAGWVDPGWVGQLTLEMVNHGPWRIRLWPGMKIAQINFMMMNGHCAVPYGSTSLGSHYQEQVGPTAARGVLHEDRSIGLQERDPTKVDR